jgi:hypothetical protein
MATHLELFVEQHCTEVETLPWVIRHEGVQFAAEVMPPPGFKQVSGAPALDAWYSYPECALVLSGDGRVRVWVFPDRPKLDAALRDLLRLPSCDNAWTSKQRGYRIAQRCHNRESTERLQVRLRSGDEFVLNLCDACAALVHRAVKANGHTATFDW